MQRLADDDFNYWLVREGLGWSVVLQMGWEFPSAPSAGVIERFSVALRSSQLNRKIVRSPVPCAPPVWAHSDDAVDVTDTGPTDNAVAWFDEAMYQAPLDPERGPAVAIRLAHNSDGGFLLSVCCLHLVADGQRFVESVGRAMADAQGSDSLATAPISLSRWAEARASGRAIAEGAGAAWSVLRASRRSGPAPAADADRMAPRTPQAKRAPQATYSWVTVSVPLQQWDSVARAHGGTSNSLFIAVLSALVATDRVVKVGVPVSTRTEDGPAGNATAGVSVYLDSAEVRPGESLRSVREKAKAAFTTLSRGHRPAAVRLVPLLRLLPTSLLLRAARSGDGMPDVVASNIGSYGDDIRTVGDIRATSVFFRGIAQGVNPELPYRFGDGVQAWLLASGDQVTFSVVAFDTSIFGDEAALRAAVREVLEGWTLPHRIH